MARRLGAVLAVLSLAALAVPPPTSGVTIVYTLVATPLTATVGVTTEFTLTLTNVAGPDELGCAEVDLPSSFEVHSVSDPQATNGRNWTSLLTGNNIVVHANNGGGRLELLESVTFTITATPTQALEASWSNHAHRTQNCDDSEQTGLPVLVTVLPQLLPTPSPTPAPTATPAATPRPTAVPTPRPSATTSAPSASASPLAPAPTARPDGTVRPTPSPTPEPSASERATPAAPTAGTPSATPAPAPGSGTAGGPPAIQLAPADPARGGSLNLAPLDVLSGAATFAVPAAALGGPGLLILAWVGAQTVGAATWIPAVRGLRGRDPEEDDS